MCRLRLRYLQGQRGSPSRASTATAASRSITPPHLPSGQPWASAGRPWALSTCDSPGSAPAPPTAQPQGTAGNADRLRPTPAPPPYTSQGASERAWVRAAPFLGASVRRGNDNRMQAPVRPPHDANHLTRGSAPRLARTLPQGARHPVWQRGRHVPQGLHRLAQRRARVPQRQPRRIQCIRQPLPLPPIHYPRPLRRVCACFARAMHVRHT